MSMIRKVKNTLRRHAGAFVVDNAFRGLARLGKLHPRARPSEHGVEVKTNIHYLHSGMSEHLLDVYRPAGRSANQGGPLPIVLYVHGGGFRMLSKDTHWMMGLAFARRGYLVFSVNYRLAPRYRYPAAIDDVCAAYLWITKHAGDHGGDLRRLILAGESAGANLVSSLALATAYRRPEPWAAAVFDTKVRPTAVLPACGLLQVSDPARFLRRKQLPGFLFDRIEEVHDCYLGRGSKAIDRNRPGGIDLADPLLIMERGDPPDRPIPPFFMICGTKDPLLDDSRRAHEALTRLGVPSELRVYPGEVHAFHAMIWRPQARQSWKDSFLFLERCLAPLADAMTSTSATG